MTEEQRIEEIKKILKSDLVVNVEEAIDTSELDERYEEAIDKRARFINQVLTHLFSSRQISKLLERPQGDDKGLLTDEEKKVYHHTHQYQVGDEITGLHTITEDDWDIDGLLKAQRDLRKRLDRPKFNNVLEADAHNWDTRELDSPQ